MPIVNLWKFFGWFSRDDRSGKDGSYIYSENIDNISNTSYIQLARKPTRIYTGDEKITHILSYTYNNQSNWKFDLLFGRNWNVWNKAKQEEPIYRFQAEATNYEAYLSQARNKIFSKVWVWKWGYIYFIAPEISGDSEEYRFQLSYKQLFRNVEGFNFFPEPDKPWDGTRQRGSEITLDEYYYINLYNDNVIMLEWFMYIFERWNITKINLVTGWVERKEMSYAMAGVTYNWWWFRIYWFNWQMALWDWASENVSQIYQVADKIEKVLYLESIDYLLSNWLRYNESILSKELFKKTKTSYIPNFEKFKLLAPSSDSMKWSNGLIYALEKRQDSGYDLVVFGNLVSGSPMSYTKWYSALNYEEVYYMESGNDGVRVSYKDIDGTYWVDFFNFNEIEEQEKVESWFIITREYYQEPLADTQKSTLLKVFVKWLDTENDSIKIEYAVNWWEFEELEILDNNTILQKWQKQQTGWWCRSITKVNKDFHVIVFKLTLIGNAKLYDLIFSYG
jgi:hypothetical protein